MKKIFIIAAAVATLAACQKNSSVEIINNPADDNAIGFSAYTATAVTKGTVVDATDFKTDGIGVFAFYQPATNGVANNFNSKKYATPDFMYNTNVKPANPSASPLVWEYSPVKYWPNNTNDQVSFFAYAPYKADKTWEDLGFSTDINATKLTATFPVYNEKAAMVDYLFATPALNKQKQTVAASTTAPTENPIVFEFKHIMSKVDIQIGAIVDKVPAGTPEAWDDANTTITVEKLEFKGIAESYDYTYTIASANEEWKENGSQDFVLTAAARDFQNNTSDNWTENKWYPLLSQETPAGSSDAEDAFLFIAPQDLLEAKMVVTYKVATIDADNAANSSTITNVIEKKIGVNFETGKAYTLKLLIGMKSVELSADVVDWVNADPKQIDVPANE